MTVAKGGEALVTVGGERLETVRAKALAGAPVERGILFRAEMVRAILSGTKTQTRRTIKTIQGRGGGQLVRLPGQGSVIKLAGGLMWTPAGSGPTVPWPMDRIGEACPYGGPGDRLWVRETWATGVELDPHSPTRMAELAKDAGWRRCWAPVKYAADGHESGQRELISFGGGWGKSRRSIHMPRWASRITLEITEVRVQRLREISEADAKAEGCECRSDLAWGGGGFDGSFGGPYDYAVAHGYRADFRRLWESINGAGSWDANPWVWALSFRKLEVPHG